MADKTKRTFGYSIQDDGKDCCNKNNSSNKNCNGCTVAMSDILQYINSYIDCRAKQLFDALKSRNENVIEGIKINGNHQLPDDNKFVNLVLKAETIPFDDSSTIKGKIDNIDGSVDTISHEVTEVKQSIGDVEESIENLTSSVRQNTTNIGSLQENIDTVNGEITNLNNVKTIVETHIKDNTSDDYFILRDKNNPSKKYKVFIVDGTICSDPV